jgi:DNA topoisomerase I
MQVILASNYLLLKQFGGAPRKWNTLEHNGVLFPPEYVKHNVPVIYKGKKIILDEASEEFATLYARYIESEYVKSKVFRKNFWKDWSKILGKDHQIQSLDDVDFSLIYNYLIKKKEEKKLQPVDKEAKAKEEEKYKTAILDGKPQPVGNFRVEPPGIFLGRGCSPNLGKIKPRIYPEDIIINIGERVPVPPPLPGHKWKLVAHDHTVEWLASWKDIVTGKMKYVYFGASSEIKNKNDTAKFDLAKKLGKNINKIRVANMENAASTNVRTQQIATALYFIENFALRVGNEKGEDETDTVGVTTLRNEHITLLPDNKIKLDFLGKDSVRYHRTVEVDPQIYRNIASYLEDKSPSDQLFHLINPSDVNKYLQGFMPKLTAKVFRTYKASHLFQEELNKINKKFDKVDSLSKINLILDEFNRANAKVALLCNHQKNINKSNNEQIKKINDSIKAAKEKLAAAKSAAKKNPDKIKKLTESIKKLQSKKLLKTELKNLSLGTSKINYIDPRIAVAFIKKHNLPIDSIFTKTLQQKFQWAIPVNADFVF